MTSPSLHRLVFEKWEGLGNDFVLLDRSAQSTTFLTSERIRRICDRRLGIGADGVLLVDPPSSEPARMIVFNADGSRPEMCGNGLRCVAAYVARTTLNLVPGRQATFPISTDAGPKVCSIEPRSPDDFDVEVAMGIARFGPPLIVPIEGLSYSFATVDLGNPHAVTFEPHTQTDIDRIAPIVAVTPELGINVEFCRITRSEEHHACRIEVTVWERGVGRTLACGTGACAVAAVACHSGRSRLQQPIRIALPGGELEITVSSSGHEISMKGPARRVFQGEVRVE